ncbi:hypothetical protein BD626DRAFT_472922 [Schizophyllum amplum]|uniref:Nab2 type CCCH zinc finger 4 domain-containing protein n=1 Tax=Schizophyllum amplum TaxID=97359 RepID=A0A550CWD2_9AGAR|nr:hypothetical protein BD626DRAFT_472922 [Auriculariopsis ampla]
MPFGLTIGTERAAALQTAIQNELTRRGLSADDAVMAEYITIMIINNKTSTQITAELNDLIGPEYESSFTDWLFEEAARTAPEESASAPPASAAAAAPDYRMNELRSQPPTAPASQRDQSRGPRNGVYQQALSAALPSSSNKRPASARTPSPGHPNKMRRTDLPTGPRAMLRGNDNVPNGGPPPPRSLLERVGPRQDNFPNGDMQHMAGMSPEMMMAAANGGFPNGMDMMNMGGNPMMLQEMMMNQMALMAQMASSMGIINPATGQFGGNPGNGFPMDVDMRGFQGNGPNNGAFQRDGRGRGGPRGRGSRGGRGGHTGPRTSEAREANGAPAAPLVIAAPQPKPASAAPTPAPHAFPGTPQRPGYAVPERPQSPTLCKYATKCINAHCRYSHPSPVATTESGMVLSNEPCENGKDCKDKDCTKAHVSPAVLHPNAEQSMPQRHAPPPTTQVPCKFGAACTRPNCSFYHPSPAANHNNAQPCRFGAACTRATCPFQHPEGRVLPTSFHRGMGTSGPMVNIRNPETGTMAGSPGASHNKTMTFNNGNVQDQLAQQEKELAARKKELAEKEAKRDEAPSVAAAS